MKRSVVLLPDKPCFWLPLLFNWLQGGGLCDVDNLRTLCVACHADVTKPQTKKLMALFNALEVTDRDDRMALCVSLAGRPLSSSKDLTKAEASHIIDRLSAVEAGTADIVFDDGVPTVADSLGQAS